MNLLFVIKSARAMIRIKDAIEMLAQKGSKAPLYKEVFPQIGEKYNMSAASVERDIRYLLKGKVRHVKQKIY